MAQKEMNVIFDNDQYEWVRATAFNRRLSMSAIIRLALTRFIAEETDKENKKG